MGKFTRTSAATLATVIGLGLSACSDDATSTVDEATAPAGQAVVERADGATDAGDDGVAPTAEIADGPATNLGAATALQIGSRAIAIDAGVAVATDDIRRAVDATLDAVARHDARVIDADVDIGGERDDGSVDGAGWFVVRVPPTDLESLVADLGESVGDVTGRTQESSDVTDQLVDLEIRIDVERDVIDRFRALLTDAVDLDDIVSIERVISERTIALEQLLASRRNLEDRVDDARLTIELRYEAPAAGAVDERDGDGIVDAWGSGWDVFAGALFTVGFVFVVALPFLVTALLVLGSLWLVVRRGRAASSAPTGSGSTDKTTAAPSPTLTDERSLAGPTPRE